jgi:hypothetical protein
VLILVFLRDVDGGVCWSPFSTSWIESTGESRCSRPGFEVSIFWSLLSAAWSSDCELSLCVLSLNWSSEDWGLLAAIVAMFGVVEGDIVVILCLRGHVG